MRKDASYPRASIGLAAMRGLFLAAGVLACGSDPTPADPAGDRSDVPPTGIYEVSVHVKADDCSPAYAAPAPWRTRVLAQAEGDVAKVNLPLSAIPPSTKTTSSARSDFRLDPGYEVARKHTPVPSCTDFSIDYVYSLMDVARDGFALSVEAKYGAAGPCPVPEPTACTTQVQYDYELVERECAAECTYGERPAPAAGKATIGNWEVDCRC
jgi:hypothetical protein